MDQTARFGLPLLQAGQAQKEITHNEAVARADTLLHLAVDSRHAAAPATAAGTWLVPPGATGIWAGQGGAIAILDETGWTFIAPIDGCIAYVRDEAVFIHHAAGQWQDPWPVKALALAGPTTKIAVPAGGLVVDNEVRAVVAQLVVALQAVGLIGTG